MRRNVFLKSTLRRPVRGLLLAVLVLMAAFMLVARVTEYAVVMDELARMEGEFRSVGFLSPINPRNITGDLDASAAAEIVAASGFVVSDDRREFAQGILADATNVTAQQTGAPIFNPEIEGIGVNAIDQYFLATARFNMHSPNLVRGSVDFIHITLDVTEIVAGDPGALRPGFRHFAAGDGRHLPLTSRVDMVLPLTYDEANLYEAGYFDPLEGLQPGIPFLFRAAPGIFIEEGAANWVLRPLIDSTFFANPRTDLEIMAQIQTRLDLAYENAHSMMVIGTTDMGNIARIQNPASARLLTTGRGADSRWLTYEDYLNQNHVAVLPMQMATRKGLWPGETFTINLVENPRPSWIDAETQSRFSPRVEGWWSPNPQGWWATTEYHEGWRQRRSHELTLEVVGIYHNHPIGQIHHNFLTTEMYIPASIMPPGFSWDGIPLLPTMYNFVLDSPRNEAAFLNETELALQATGFRANFQPNGFADFIAAADPMRMSITVNLILFSIIAALVLILVVFLYLREWRRTIAISRALGDPAPKTLRRLFAPSLLLWIPAIALGAVFAWFFALGQASAALAGVEIAMIYGVEEAAAFPITWELVAAVFLSVVLLGDFVSAIVSWFKELPFARARGRAIGQVLRRVFPFWTPLILISAGGAWALTLQQMPEDGFSEIFRTIADIFGGNIALYELVPVHLDAIWLYIMMGTIATSIFLGLYLSGMTLARRPVLLQLQGGGQSKRKKSASVVEADTLNEGFVVSSINISYENVKFSARAKIRAIFVYIFRHIFRSPLKSALVAAIALFFVVGLGWLNHTIESTQAEIDYIWENTVIGAEIIMSPDENRIMTGIMEIASHAPISPAIVRTLLQSGFVTDFYTEALWMNGFVRSQAELEPMREFLQTPGRLWWHYTDPVFAISDFYGFVRDNTRTDIDDALGIIGESISITFAPGFDVADFNFSPVALNTPIIARQSFLDYHGYNLGDYLYLGHPHIPVQIIASFQGGLSRGVDRIGSHRHMIIMPLAALQNHILGDMAGHFGFMTANVSLDPARNRELYDLEDLLRGSLRGNRFAGFAGAIPLELIVRNQALLDLVEPMEQNLALLRLLYPIAIVIAAALSIVLSMLLMLQNTKIVAIMRVLGGSKLKSRFALCAEQVLVCITGVLAGLAALAIIGVPIAETAALNLAALYFIGATTGALLGAAIISSKTPIELLQIKE
ncbi:MAG: hypothetical protein LBE35_09200 [Clostridiales bacterium]|jgi:ABC-type antimicrobial peptide transport system permease subunit|nr:hypothetical protein [Clostridiales bacterium]